MKTSNINILTEWLNTELPCVAGFREFKRKRYFITELKSKFDIVGGFQRFIEALVARETVAGLFVIHESVALPGSASAKEQMLQCAEFVGAISDQSAETLLHGGKLSKKIELRCPVTDQYTWFNDFDAVAFCPQAADTSDVLYDPMMATPVPCINFNSDIYAYSMFVRDTALTNYHREVFELPDRTRSDLFGKCEELWQKFALRTINGYMNMTDLAKCPIAITETEEQWLANHQDPAFAETTKKPYLHDLPVKYTPRITAAWQKYFGGGELDMSWQAITPYGEPT